MKVFRIIFIMVSAIFVMITILFIACGNPASSSSASGAAKEVEATEFQGTKLTPINKQGNNALAGTQNIDRQTYRLIVDGLVENPLTLTYEQLSAYPQESWLMTFNCVEGWNFTAKWTGPQINSILKDAIVKPEAKIIIFHTTDVPNGYSSLDLAYIRDNNILLALKLNDVTLPAERGFPFQVAAKSKFGYKWAKWVVRMEVSSDINFRGYWETAGYNNNADENGPAFESGN
ncbi:MAG: molybdopterin-dependent oxidoreductase [Candidatus Humimicrobiaceae bacterium]